jgi:hypothetical protein
MDSLVNIDVDDLPKAVAFCESAFGLKVGRRLGTFRKRLLFFVQFLGRGYDEIAQ